MVSVRSVLVILLGFVFKTSYARVRPVIVNGERASIAEYPHAAYLDIVYWHKQLQVWRSCGASILHEKILLTAAHCVVPNYSTMKKFQHVDKSQISQKIFATVGHTNITRKEKHVVIYYQVPDNFNIKTHRDDIALLKLEGLLIFGNKVNKVQLVKSRPYGLARIAGWGIINDNTSTDVLWQLRGLKVWSMKECKDKFRGIDDTMYLTQDVICAGNSNTHGIINIGDSGSGLIMDENIVVGVVSWTAEKYPEMQVYANVQYHYEWIMKNLKMLIRGRYKANHFG